MVDDYYTSTRDNHIKISAKQALLNGYADYQGLFVLPTLPTLEFDLSDLKKLNYPAIVQRVLTLLLPDFSETEIIESIQAVYPAKFSNEAVTPLKDVDDFHVLELFHGPTGTFQDLGLQLLPQLMQRSVPSHHQLTVLATTSEIDGVLAFSGFEKQPQMETIIFLADTGLSVSQQSRQFTNDNHQAVAVIANNLETLQTSVKKIFYDDELKAKLGQQIVLASADSNNIGRIIPQVAYFFSAYQQLLAKGTIKLGDKVSFTIPTGNFSAGLAGYYAKQLGLPIEKLVVACNENNALVDFFATGIFDRNQPRFKTNTPRMDVQVATNFEQLLYYMSGQNSNYINHLMEELEATGTYRVSEAVLDQVLEQFACGYSSDRDIEDSIRMVYDKYDYLMDPHTASGYKVMREVQSENLEVPMILLSTAHPYKFADSVADALFGKHEKDVQTTIAKIKDATKVPIPQFLAGGNSQTSDLIPGSTLPLSEVTDFVYQKVKARFGDD